MKWFLAALVAANVLIALLGALSKPVVTDIKARESNANQISLVPTGEISPLAALTAPRVTPAPEAGPADAAPASPPVTSLAAALAPEPAHSTIPLPAPVAAVAPAPAGPLMKPELKPVAKSVESKPRAEPLATKPVEVKTPEPKPSAKAEAKLADDKPELARTEKSKPRLVCYQSGELDATTAAKLKAALNKAGLASRMQESVRETGRVGGKFWVYLPGQNNRDEVLRLSASLKDKGFDNYVINTDGEHKNALSMGLFSQEDSARAMLKRLVDSGYPAKLAPRGGNQVSSSMLRVDGLDEAASAALTKATAGLAGLKPTSCKF